MKKIGTSDYVTTNAPYDEAVDQHVPYIGWYQPHAPVDWTGEILDTKTGELVKEASMTKQAHKDECDINNIVRSFNATGVITHLKTAEQAGVFADLPDNFEYQDALNLVISAQASFDTLPSDIRARFGNDPAQFLAFTGDPSNQDELIKMGLATDSRPPSTPPVTTPTITEPPAGSSTSTPPA